MRNGIMVPLDGTSFAEAALPAAMYLARRDGVSLQLVTVWQPMLPLYDTTGWIEEVDRERHAQQHTYMAEIARKVEAALGRPVAVEYLKGRPGELLPPLPEARGLDLVVMATHGYGPILRASLGSVADQMVRKGTAPVLLLRPDEDEPEVELTPAAPFRKILIPLDGSELAERALQESVLEGSGSPVEITLLRVVAFPVPLVVPEGGVAIEMDGKIVQAEKDAAQAYLDRVADQLAWNCRVTTEVVAAASTWAGIVDFAAANGFDLIAMSTHGRGGAARLLLGSMADRVVRSSTVPVLLFHPERSASPWKDVERLAGQVVGMP